MSQDNTGQAHVAEISTQETGAYFLQVRTRTRRKYAPEDKIRIVLEGFRREFTVSDLCRREGIKPGVFYAWTENPSWRIRYKEYRPVTPEPMTIASNSSISSVRSELGTDVSIRESAISLLLQISSLPGKRRSKSDQEG